MRYYATVFLLTCVTIGCSITSRVDAASEGSQTRRYGDPIAWRVIDVPPTLLADKGFAGDIRMGDLDGDGQVEFVVFRSIDNGMKPSFIGAFDIEGKVLWSEGSDGGQPLRPGPVTVYDFDGDGCDEVLCFFIDPAVEAEASSMKNVVVQIRDGCDGAVRRQVKCPEMQICSGSGANWCHQRLLIANFRGTAWPQDFVVKLGSKVLAFDDRLNLLWTYTIKWNEYSRCSAYIPALGDIDGDGRDEVNGGFYILDSDGRPMWEGQIARHMDSVAIVPWDNGKMRAICSGFGHILDENGQVILKLGEEQVPHGQEARVADFDTTSPGPEMIVRYNGHTPNVLAVANDAHIVRHFQLNDSPNHTGMEAIYWNGPGHDALLYNGGMLWRASGEIAAQLPGLPKPVGPAKMGWYHCIPANVCGDAREEVVLYNPWDRRIWIFTPAPLKPEVFKSYKATPRQYNARLMD